MPRAAIDRGYGHEDGISEQWFKKLELSFCGPQHILGGMSTAAHPDLADVSLASVLHALADPVRLTVVRRLADGEPLNCGATVCPNRELPKSTVSHHLSVLRSAGLIETSAMGREKVNTLRRSELDDRFPGLLDAVLFNR